MGNVKLVGYINENGYMYGAWDEHNNIWLFGETTGIQVFGLNENEEWIKKEGVDIDELPYPIKKVVDYYSTSICKTGAKRFAYKRSAPKA